MPWLISRVRALGIEGDFDPSISEQSRRIDTAKKTPLWKKNERYKLRQRITTAIHGAEDRLGDADAAALNEIEPLAPQLPAPSPPQPPAPPPPPSSVQIIFRTCSWCHVERQFGRRDMDHSWYCSSCWEEYDPMEGGRDWVGLYEQERVRLDAAPPQASNSAQQPRKRGRPPNSSYIHLTAEGSSARHAGKARQACAAAHRKARTASALDGADIMS